MEDPEDESAAERSNQMPLNLRETVGGFNHLRLGLQRQLLNRPVDHFLKRFSAPSHEQHLTCACDEHGQPAVCHICGYAVARLELVGGWILETCSATGLFPVLRSGKFQDWVRRLPVACASGGQTELSAANLPGPGV